MSTAYLTIVVPGSEEDITETLNVPQLDFSKSSNSMYVALV